MNRMNRTILAMIFVAVITVSAVVVVTALAGTKKVDITAEKLYTLSEGTKTILNKINQPVTIKLFYAKTATTKALDEIKGYNDYYYFVKALLEEYASVNNKIKLEIIDPRPFSEQEQEALLYGLKRFAVTEEEGFFFGLVAKTEYGAVKTIEFFAPDRQNLIEYDISYLLDTLTTRQKSKIGVLSSLPVMGEDLSPYMMQMMQQTGQRPQQPWVITRHLGQKYEFEKIATDAASIEGVDMLLVIHPKDLSEKTLFAIDQFVLKGGRAIFMVDPFCLTDIGDPQQQMYGQTQHDQSSSINELLNKWGVNVPADAYAGDKTLAEVVQLNRNSSPEKLIGFLSFNSARGCFNKDNVISSALANVKTIFGGVVEPVESMADQISFTPLVTTSKQGNTWKPVTPISLQRLDPRRLMEQFTPGDKTLAVGALITGKFKSAFPEGIEQEAKDTDEQQEQAAEPEKIAGLTEAAENCNIIVFADVDFVGDSFAYNVSPFGAAPNGDNAALLMNSIDNLLGSDDLIAIRSRGNFRRPFTLVDKIEAEAEARTEEQVKQIQDDIAGFEKELNNILSEARGQGQLVIDATQFEDSRKGLELKIHESKKKLRDAQLARREGIEKLGNKLALFNTAAAPAVILVIAICLTIQRSIKRSSYIARNKG
ncbi:MAG: GldG family protein [Sedimentisphaerales bacterium]|nr:GldG family protein [Sedimentisphaerales bacterium]